jgi:hypothetical protein
MRQVLKIVIRKFGSLPFEENGLEQAALEEGLSGAHVKSALLAMRRCGIVFALRKAWREELLVIPEEALPVWVSLLFPGALTEAADSMQERGESVGEAGCAAYDVLYLMHMADNGQLKTTRQGELAKPALRKLQEGLAVSGEEAGLCPEKQVLRMARSSGLLAERPAASGLQPSVAALVSWLSRSVADVQRELYGHWKQTGSDEAEAWQLIASACIEQAAPNRWYRLDLLFEWLRDCGMIKDIADNLQQDFVRSCLIPMQAFGWIRLLLLDGCLAFSIPFSLSGESGQAADGYDGFIVQSDLEIVVPPYPPLSLLWELLNWSELASRGQISVFRLTGNSVRRAAERGIAADSINRILQRHSLVPVEPAVTLAVKEWCGGREQGAECSAMFILAEKQATGDGEMGQDIAGRVPLEEARAPELACLPVPAAASAEAAAALWKDVPVAWWRTPARYHPSTEKELARKAIERKAMLGLTRGASVEERVVPLSLREAENGWRMEAMLGTGRISLQPGDWTQIRLVIPGMND